MAEIMPLIYTTKRWNDEWSGQLLVFWAG